MLTLQTLGINPNTYTPENLLTLARLVSHPSSPTDVAIKVRLIPRPKEKQSGMGRQAREVEPEVEEGQDDTEYKWSDILAREWKLVA